MIPADWQTNESLWWAINGVLWAAIACGVVVAVVRWRRSRRP